MLTSLFTNHFCLFIIAEVGFDRLDLIMKKDLSAAQIMMAKIKEQYKIGELQPPPRPVSRVGFCFACFLFLFLFIISPAYVFHICFWQGAIGRNV